MLNIRQFIQIFTIVLLCSAVNAFAQGSAFVYQGKLQDGGTAANGTYQFEFRLFDAAAGGSQVGQTLSGIPATVTNGQLVTQATTVERRLTLAPDGPVLPVGRAYHAAVRLRLGF